MVKYLKISGILLFISVFLIISACSKKNLNVNPQENTNIQEDSQSSTQNNTSATENKATQQDAEIQPIINNKSKFKLLRNEQTKLLNSSFIQFQANNQFVPLDNTQEIYLVNSIPINNTALEYAKSYFQDFVIIGYSLITLNKPLKTKNIKVVAQKYGANVAIYKSIYNTYGNNYIVEVIYLNGDLTSPKLFLNRNSSEAIPIETTLTSRSVNNVKDNTKHYTLNSISAIKDHKDNTGNNHAIDLTNVGKIQEGNTDLSQESETVQQENSLQLLENRINTVVGLWMDSYDKSVVSIREISRKTMAEYNNGTLINSNVIKYYGAYIILNNNKEEVKYNKLRNINTADLFKWKNEDLKFQFNSSGNTGIYLNKNKMPEIAVIKPFPVKGILMVTMSNGETRYYLPLDLDIDPKFIKNLYKTLPSYIKPVSKQDTLTYHYGTGLYGWIITGGMMLLGLGLLSMF